MPRTPARFTQADIARAIRAADQCGPGKRVRIERDGTIIIETAETGHDYGIGEQVDKTPELTL